MLVWPGRKSSLHNFQRLSVNILRTPETILMRCIIINQKLNYIVLIRITLLSHFTCIGEQLQTVQVCVLLAMVFSVLWYICVILCFNFLNIQLISTHRTSSQQIGMDRLSRPNRVLALCKNDQVSSRYSHWSSDPGSGFSFSRGTLVPGLRVLELNLLKIIQGSPLKLKLSEREYWRYHNVYFVTLLQDNLSWISLWSTIRAHFSVYFNVLTYQEYRTAQFHHQ